MAKKEARSRFQARPLRPKESACDDNWAFVVLPREVSAKLPGRGRSTVSVALNGYQFEALLEPDGQKSHWLRISQEMLDSAGAAVGCKAKFEIAPVDREPEPQLPNDFSQALEAAPEAQATWDATTTLARVDWIHWITSARQLKTREKRISDACDMLADGKKRVCCFDPSGFYSKAFSAPQAEESVN